VSPPEIAVGVRVSLLYDASNKQSYSQNDRDVEIKCGVIEEPRSSKGSCLRAEYSATEIIRFFEYPRSTVYDVVAKYMALKQFNKGSSSMLARKSYSKECENSRSR